MAQPYDIAVKTLVESYPRDWARMFGAESDVETWPIDADLATVTGEADKVLLVSGDPSWILDLDFQSSYRKDLPERKHFHSTLLRRRHEVLVCSVIVLLRREADGPAMRRALTLKLAGESQNYLTFRFRVLRLWELATNDLLTGGLGTVPLAPLTDDAAGQLPRVVDEVQRRVRDEAPPTTASSLSAAAYVLMGLRYSKEMIDGLNWDVRTMEESSTYQAILAEGEARGRTQAAREILLDLGVDKFGAAPPEVVRRVERVSDFDTLERLIRAVDHSSGWEQLLVAADSQ